MRLSIATFAFALAATTSAQLSLSNLTSLVSAPCLGAVLGLLQSNLTTCLNIAALAPLVTSPNSSIVPVLDAWMTGLCAQPACSNATITNATNALLTGCATDLAMYNVTNTTVLAIVAQYPLARDVVCLKTTMPANFTNASIPLTSPTFNTTNGTFCITSELSALSGYLNTSLTGSFLYNTAVAAISSNSTMSLRNLTMAIPASVLCTDCVVASVDLVLERYPSLLNSSFSLGNYSLGNMTLANSTLANSTMSGNITLARFFNATCPASNYTLNANGTLPPTVFEAAFNSTGNTTMLYRRWMDVTAAKRRWVGQY